MFVCFPSLIQQPLQQTFLSQTGETFLGCLALILKNKAPCQAISSEPSPCLLHVPREAVASPVFINTH